MRHLSYLACGLLVFWVLNSGHDSVLMFVLGLISVLCVVALTHRMDILDDESKPLHLTFEFFSYIAWLLKEMIVANIVVVKHIWLGNKSISPVLTTIKFEPMSDFQNVLYANSITLTPGTVTVELSDHHITVHSLLEENIRTLEQGDMCKRISSVSK